MERQTHIDRLEAKLETATKEFRQHPTKQARAIVDDLWADLDLCLTERAERHIRWMKQKFYAGGKK